MTLPPPPATGFRPQGQVVEPSAGRGGPALRDRAPVTGDLEAFAGTDEDQRLALLERDAALVDRLMWNGYAGPEWREFVRALAAYGVQVIRSWVLSGTIFVKCREKRMGLNSTAAMRVRADRRDDAQELANETVARAIVAFRDKVLIPRKWDPTQGASLRTFFVGQCIFQFPNVYRAWEGEVQEPQIEGLLPEMLLTPQSDPSQATMVAQQLRTLSPREPRMLLLLQAGYTYAEIARELGTTWRAVESRLRRLKKKGEP